MRSSSPITKQQGDLIDFLINHMKLKNDAALSRKLEVLPPVLSKIRHLKLPIGAAFLINAHEVSGLQIRDMKRVAGLTKEQLEQTK